MTLYRERALWVHADFSRAEPDAEGAMRVPGVSVRVEMSAEEEAATRAEWAANEQRSAAEREAARLDALADALARLRALEAAAADPRTRDAGDWAARIKEAEGRVEALTAAQDDVAAPTGRV